TFSIGCLTYAPHNFCSTYSFRAEYGQLASMEQSVKQRVPAPSGAFSARKNVRPPKLATFTGADPSFSHVRISMSWQHFCISMEEPPRSWRPHFPRTNAVAAW